MARKKEADKFTKGLAAMSAVDTEDIYRFKNDPNAVMELITDYVARPKISINDIVDERVKKMYFKWADAACVDTHDSESWGDFVRSVAGEKDLIKNNSLYDLYKLGIKIFNKKYAPDTRINYNGLSAFAGLCVETFRKLKPSEVIPGVDIPGKWSTEFSLDKVSEFLNCLEGNALLDFWQQVLLPPNATNTLTTIASLDRQLTPEECKTQKFANFSFERGAINIPGMYALDDNLSNLTKEDLLPIFPEVERKIFCYWLGRAFMGGKDIETIDVTGKRPNDWRYAVIVSGDPQTGKSFLIEQVLDYAKKVGLDTANTDLGANRFGGERVARSHIAYNMDATADQLFGWTRIADTNSMISGDYVPVEEKYQARRECLSHTAIIIACNNPTFGGNMPPGAVDRLLVLQTLPKDHLRNSGIGSLYHHWDRLVKKMKQETGIDYNFLSLMAALVARSVEEYAEKIGIRYNEETGYHEVAEESRMVQEIDNLRKGLVFRTTTNVPTKLARSTVKATAITKWLYPYRNVPMGHHQLKYGNLGHVGRLVLACWTVPSIKLNVDTEVREQVNELADKLANWLVEDLNHYHYPTWTKLAAKSAHYDSISFAPTAPDLTTCLKDLIKEIAVDTGEPVPQGTTRWTHGLSEEHYYQQVEAFINEINDLAPDDTLREVFKQALIGAGNCDYPMTPGSAQRPGM